MTLIRVPQPDFSAKRTKDKESWLRDDLAEDESLCRSLALQNTSSKTAVFMAMVDARTDLILSDDDYTQGVEDAYLEVGFSEEKRDHLISLSGNETL